jgi:regulator of sigma E protease
MVGVSEPIAKLRQPERFTPAYETGIRGNETVIAVNAKPIQLWSELRWELMRLAMNKQPATLTLAGESFGQPRQVILSLDQFSHDELQSNFLNKLGLHLAFSKAQLGEVKANGSAMRAGLQKGDIVLEIDRKQIADSFDLVETVRASPNKLLHFRVDRSGALREFLVVPDAVNDESGGRFGRRLVGQLNVEVRSLPEMQNHQDSFFAAVQNASQRTWDTSVLILKTMGRMVVGEVSLKNVTGPLTIADYAGQSAKIGLLSYISFLAFISISLGVMNLLPIPILDGGHLLYYSLEVLSGRQVSPRVWEIAQRAGTALLMLLMALAFFNDIMRLLPR